MTTHHFIAVVNHELGGELEIKAVSDEFNKDDMMRYKRAAHALREWVASDQFVLLEHSYDQYLATAESLRKQYQSPPLPEGDVVRLTLNFALLGFLSMVRLYLDHAEFQLKKLPGGEKSSEFKAFKKVTAHEYDSVFAYRFCVALRNYAQHCGFPISGFNASAELMPGSSNKKFSFMIDFDRNHLLRSYDRWKGIIKEDLKIQPEHFSVEGIVKDFMACLRRIQDNLILNAKPRLLEYVNFIQGLMKKAEAEKGTPVILRLKVVEGSNLPKPTLIKFPLRHIELLTRSNFT